MPTAIELAEPPAQVVLDGAVGLALATGAPISLSGPVEGADLALLLAAVKVGDPDQVEGARERLSRAGRIELTLQRPRAGVHLLNLPEPGAVARAIWTLSWPLALLGKPSEVRFAGPNHVDGSPTFHELRLSWCAWAAQLGLRVQLELTQAAFGTDEGEIVASLDPAPALTALHAAHRGILRQVTVVAAVAGGRQEEPLLAAKHAARMLRRQGIIAEAERVPLPVGSGAQTRGRWALTATAEFESSVVSVSALGPGNGVRLGPERDAAVDAGEKVAEQLGRFLARRGAMDATAAERLLLPCLLSAAGLGARAGPPPTCHFTTSEVTAPLVELATLARVALPVRAVVDGAVGDEGVVVVAPATA